MLACHKVLPVTGKMEGSYIHPMATPPPINPRARVCLHLSTECHHHSNNGYPPEILIPLWTKKPCPKRSYRWVTYISMALYAVVCSPYTEDLWDLVPLPPILLPMEDGSPVYPVLFTSNANLGLPFINTVTTHRKLEGI